MLNLYWVLILVNKKYLYQLGTRIRDSLIFTAGVSFNFESNVV